MRLSPGTEIGAYKIISPIGVGGMGEVYRARDTRLGREVAVKVLPEAVASNPHRLARFEREARTVAGLNHPNIVTLFSVENENGIRFLTMELVEGQGLATLITPGGLPLSRILDLLIPLTDALVAAHERGVIHRDLNPNNVMVTPEGRLKVLDFGLAKVMPARSGADPASLTTTADSRVSSADQVVGTVPYMAPEQIRGETVDARSDLFALGIMLYELATGRRPFTGSSSADVISSILRDAPQPLTSLRTDLPEDLDRLVARCLEKDPRERFQAARDVCNELRRVKKVLERGASSAASGSVASIAVLPFVNRSSNEEDEYFSDGLADELLNMLAKIHGLRVAARTSSFTFKRKEVTIADVGKALRVATVLEGSVRKSANRVRIFVQLVNVSDGYRLWSETYDRTLDDIFAVQDDIAQSVVKELRTTLLGHNTASTSETVKAEVASAAKGRSSNPEAHRLYLQGRHLVDRQTRGDLAKGVGYLEEAVKLDPKFALAWAELCRAYATEADWGWVEEATGYGRAREAVQRSLALEPDLAEGHARMAWIRKNLDWDFHGAEVSIRRAQELAPGSAMVLLNAAVLASNLGRLEEAIRIYRHALEQDPLSTGCYKNLGFALSASDRFSEAEVAFRKALELAPQRPATHAHLSLTLLAQGRNEEALSEAKREPLEALHLWALALIHEAVGRRTESEKALRQLIENHAERSGYHIAQVYVARGEADAAFEWLERAYAQHYGGLAGMKTSPRFRSLHGDSRWTAFLKKMGLGD